MEAALIVLVLGVNLVLWTIVGGIRVISDRVEHSTALPWPRRLSPANVAVLVPAHNEEPVIAASIQSALKLVPQANVHVVADGCDDATAEIARESGVEVLELKPGRGKAGGIEAAVKHFDIPSRFSVLLIVDADTELDEHYLERGLASFERSPVVAVAGYARAGWYPNELTTVGRFLIAYRTRLYAVMQWLKYGQTWRWTNVTSIVPGFASMYRTSILGQMDLNPPGLVIEDFNMTFEIHRKRLGKIDFRPAAYATTQDPDNFRDYYRQVQRWHLGFWQTLRRHGFWFSWFSAALALFLVEVMVASLGVVLLVSALALIGPIVLINQVAHATGWAPEIAGFQDALVVLATVLLFVAALDYLLTCVTALLLRRPVLLLYGLGFLVLRFVDGTAVLRTLPRAWRARSTGRWTSPTRRPASGAPSVVRGRQPP